MNLPPYTTTSGNMSIPSKFICLLTNMYFFKKNNFDNIFKSKSPLAWIFNKRGSEAYIEVRRSDRIAVNKIQWRGLFI